MLIEAVPPSKSLLGIVTIVDSIHSKFFTKNRLLGPVKHAILNFEFVRQTKSIEVLGRWSTVCSVRLPLTNLTGKRKAFEFLSF